MFYQGELKANLIGIGVDIIEVSRIRELMERKGERLRGRVFTDIELEAAKGGHYEKLAGRFAAKEAVSKALGQGISGIGWNEIEIMNEPSGKPFVCLHGRAKELAQARGIGTMLITMSHTEALAIAFAVAIGGKNVEDSHR
ncbi:MAG: holo-ACP synthase [Firmicutes bacterium]|nr:holo-ACP synthase [Bacillota bacterium]